MPDRIKDIEINKCIGIDLGLNNLVTITDNAGNQPIVINGKPIKSINHKFNKVKSKCQSKLQKRNKLYTSYQFEALYRNRGNKIKDYLHKTSKFIINHCSTNHIDTIIIGYNKQWKDEINIGRKNNQNFVSIPFYQLVKQIEYKAENEGIQVILTEESFTSGCSFLDNEPLTREYYNKSRRVKRGLFKSNNGKLINSDVNGSYNIIKKVIPNVFDCIVNNGIKGVSLHPVIM